MSCPRCVRGFVLHGECLNCGYAGPADPEAVEEARRRDEAFEERVRMAWETGAPPPRRRRGGTHIRMEAR